MNDMVRKRIAMIQNTYHTKKIKQKKLESHGAKQAKLRPANFKKLSVQEQWDIDKALGILDWDGS